MPGMTVRTWDSLSEFIDHCAGPARTKMRTSRTEGNRYGFFKCDSFEEAQGIAFNWTEGVERIERIRAGIALRNERVRKEVVSREAGPGTLAMGKYLAGHPQPFMCMVDSKQAVKGKGKIVHILLNIAVNATVSTEVIETRGAAVLALADALERAGRRVQITVGDATRTTEGNIDYRVTVKRAERKLNLKSVAFAIANPDMERRFMFSAQEIDGNGSERKGYGAAMAFANVPADTLHIGEARGRDAEWANEETAAAWVRATLEAQGVRIR